MRITLDDTPDPAERRRLFAAIDAFNDAATGLTAPARPLAVVLRGADGRAEGGVLGISYYGWLIVEQVYLPPALRGHHVGTLLLRAAEGEAARRGCHGIWLDTYSFQARPFYERLGFRQFGELADFPPGHRRHFMARTTLRAWDAAPGLTVSDQIDPADQAAIDQALVAFNDQAAGPGPGRAGPLAVWAHDDAGMPQGGLWARTGRGWMFVDQLILPPARRGAGLGRRMLALAEQAAHARGCIGAWLDTFDFQAPGFYHRLGWREFGRLDDYPAGHARHFLFKRLDGPSALAE